MIGGDKPMKNKNRINVLRHELGYNQQELAQKLGVTQSTISAWETGRSNPTLNQLAQLADIFRCSIDYMLGKGKIDGTRGLTEEQIFAYMAEDKEKKIQEDDYQEYRALSGEAEREAEDERAFKEYQRSKFEELHLPIFYEAFQFNEILEGLSREQRGCLMNVVNNFAKAISIEKSHN